MDLANDRVFSSVLVLDDDEGVLRALETTLSGHGYQVRGISDGQEALGLMQQSKFDLVLCDLMMPGMDGLQFLKALQQSRSARPSTVIVMSAFGTLELALEAIKLGAYDYIAKPFNAEELLLTVKKAEERERLRLENEQLKNQVSRRYSFQNIVGQSGSMKEILDTVSKIADYKTTIMILGESGTGKELVARALHFNSSRRAKPFVAINCGAIPENLLESELFGHKKGAFTDATRDKRGLFEEASGGTLFLDEVGELPPHLQVKLLRVLQENEIRPVGDTRAIPIDVRVIAATLRDLESDLVSGRFRDDLFYRLNVITLKIPPLRERREDITLLAEHFLRKHQERLKLPVRGISKDAMATLLEHTWPGNIRELENCIERAMILTETEEITADSLPPNVRKQPEPSAIVPLDGENLSIKYHSRRLEELLIRAALERTRGNRTHAARLLEISHRTLLYKLKEYRLAAPGDSVEESVHEP